MVYLKVFFLGKFLCGIRFVWICQQMLSCAKLFPPYIPDVQLKMESE